MTSRRLLSDTELEATVERLDGWVVVDGKLRKEFVFDDFVASFGFMASVALCAERMNHHPEWSNVYNRVDVHLSTHDAGGITGWDVELAEAMDRIAG